MNEGKEGAERSGAEYSGAERRNKKSINKSSGPAIIATTLLFREKQYQKGLDEWKMAEKGTEKKKTRD